jgi:hypothetical protein
MGSLVLEISSIVAFAVALILSWFPSLLLRSDNRLRPIVPLLGWSIAICMIALNALARPIYDDEVFYMAQAFEAQHGAVSSYLPLRVWSYYPFLAMHISPAAMILVSRIAMIFAAIFAGILVMSIARKIESSGFSASIVGALAALSLGNMPMGTMVPEYFAFLFLLIGIWIMFAAPARWPRAFSLFMCGFMLACACSTSLRLLLFGGAGLIALLLETSQLKRSGTLFWMLLGMFTGVLPSAFHIFAKDSIAAVVYWHYTFMKRIGIIHVTEPVTLPAILAITAAAGCWCILIARNQVSGRRAFVVMWCAATISAILNPQKLEHTLGPWLAISFIAVSPALATCLTQKSGAGSKRIYLMLIFLLFAQPMVPNVSALSNPKEIWTTVKQEQSGLRLINWLATIAHGNPVICVPPFHPVVAPNAWQMWNVIYYCYIRDRQMNIELEPNLEQTFQSKKAVVVEWDPWPEEAEASNILQYLVNREFILPEKATLLAEELQKSYRLVQWLGPLSEEFGGGRFLVRRDLKLDNQVKLLSDEMILQWKQ